jgi:hypothetical protein
MQVEKDRAIEKIVPPQKNADLKNRFETLAIVEVWSWLTR